MKSSQPGKPPLVMHTSRKFDPYMHGNPIFLVKVPKILQKYDPLDPEPALMFTTPPHVALAYNVMTPYALHKALGLID